MLHPLVAGGEKIAVEARHIVALLDQLELHIARIGKCDRHPEIVGPASIAEFIQWQLLGIEPRADPAHLYPVAHRLLDIAHDDPDLPHRPEQPAHRLLPSRSKLSTPRSLAARVPSARGRGCLLIPVENRDGPDLGSATPYSVLHRAAPPPNHIGGLMPSFST